MLNEYITKLRKESFTLLLFSISFLIFSALITYAVLPRYRIFRSGREDLARYRELISSENGYSIIKNELKSKNEQLEKSVDSFSGTRSDPGELSTFLEMLISKARVSDIRFVKIQPQTESKNDDFVLFPVVLDMRTTYHALGQFLASLEKLPYMFKVERLSITAVNESSIEVKILVTCYIPL